MYRKATPEDKFLINLLNIKPKIVKTKPSVYHEHWTLGPKCVIVFKQYRGGYFDYWRLPNEASQVK